MNDMTILRSWLLLLTHTRECVINSCLWKWRQNLSLLTSS